VVDERARGRRLEVTAVPAAVAGGWLFVAPGSWSWTGPAGLGAYDAGAASAVAMGLVVVVGLVLADEGRRRPTERAPAPKEVEPWEVEPEEVEPEGIAEAPMPPEEPPEVAAYPVPSRPRMSRRRRGIP
jgi:hypothetical protein